MNRRRFLSSLGIGVAALYLRVAPKIELPPVASAAPQWFAYQTPRVLTCYNQAYLDVMNAVMAGKQDEFIAQFTRLYIRP